MTKAITDRLRRDDMQPSPRRKVRTRRPRLMYAVVFEGRDRGAHWTREAAEAAATALGPDAYVTECMRTP